MDRDQVHFELFVRKQANASWTLEMATESRSRALEEAEAILAEKRAISVRVTKETLDPETREFAMVILLTKGDPERTKAKKAAESSSRCAFQPAGPVYRPCARPDRAAARGLAGAPPRHAVRTSAQRRPDRASRRIGHGPAARHPEGRHSGSPGAGHVGARNHPHLSAPGEGNHRSGVEGREQGRLPQGRHWKISRRWSSGWPASRSGTTCWARRWPTAIGGADRWSDKVNLLLDLADAAPHSQAGRALALQVIEQPLGEVLGLAGAAAEPN